MDTFRRKPLRYLTPILGLLQSDKLTVSEDAGNGVSRSGDGGGNAFVGNDPENGDRSVRAEAHYRAEKRDPNLNQAGGKIKRATGVKAHPFSKQVPRGYIISDNFVVDVIHRLITSKTNLTVTEFRQQMRSGDLPALLFLDLLLTSIVSCSNSAHYLLRNSTCV